MENFSNNILLSNLIKIRWVAIFGQIVAILLVYFYFEINFLIYSCFFIIFISSLINIYINLSNRTNIYLSDNEAFYFLLFDTVQLGFLLYLTGGIYNPFSLLLIAPLIISATYLPKLYSMCLLILSITVVIFISIFYLPIKWNQLFVVPDIFKYGLTFALIISQLFIFIYVYLFANSSRKISEALNEARSALADQKKLSEIGSLSAAAVHELSTPLNTIFLILNDLLQDEDIKNLNHIKEEINLLKSQADRCRNILLTLSKSPESLKDSFFDKTYLSNAIKLSFDKFNKGNIELQINLFSKDDEPQIISKDEIMYTLGNIIQNAIQHSKKFVNVDISWNNIDLIIAIKDDGNGFKNDILEQIGKPYISKKGNGMGLGIFISKNLIENIGGSIIFKNHKESGGIVEIKIKRVS